MKITDFKCEHCGASLELDLDNLMGFCPYCGSRIEVEFNDAESKLLIEHEKLKNEITLKQMEYDKEKEERTEKRKESNKNTIKYILIFIGWLLLLFFAPKLAQLFY